MMTSGTVEGETTNISAQGVSITCDEPLLLNEIYTLHIRPLDYDSIEVSGRVIWSDMYGIDGENKTVGIGVCIVEISDKDHSYFKEIIPSVGE
jgi:hypothetical protein